jgi:L-seryl-tRNA(Ser) seleniumtransferase
VDKLTLAALQATLTGPTTPTWQALRYDLGTLRARTERVRDQLAGVELVESVAVVGGGGAPELELPSWALSLPDRYAAALRLGATPVVGRVERGRLLLDLRCVPEERDPDLILAIRAALGSGGR